MCFFNDHNSSCPLCRALCNMTLPRLLWGGVFPFPQLWIWAGCLLVWTNRMWWNMMPVTEFQEASMFRDDERQGPGTLLAPAVSQPTPRHVIGPFSLDQQTPSCPALLSGARRQGRMHPAWPRSAGPPVTWRIGATTKAFCLKPFVHYTTIAQWVTPTWV